MPSNLLVTGHSLLWQRKLEIPVGESVNFTELIVDTVLICVFSFAVV
jgi:hypothetical protein